MFQSGYGDSFLIRLKQHDNAYINLMIDLGFCYSSIASKMDAILVGEEIHKFVITHFDRDHIQGVAKLISENGQYNNQSRFNIKQVWMNSYRHLNAIKRADFFDSKLMEGYIAENSNNNEGLEQGISALQASSLAADLYEYGYSWNEDAKGQAICVEHLETHTLSKSTKITLLTPTITRLEDLELSFITDLSKLGLNPTNDAVFDDAFELFNLNSESKSIINERPISTSPFENKCVSRQIGFASGDY